VFPPPGEGLVFFLSFFLSFLFVWNTGFFGVSPFPRGGKFRLPSMTRLFRFLQYYSFSKMLASKTVRLFVLTIEASKVGEGADRNSYNSGGIGSMFTTGIDSLFFFWCRYGRRSIEEP